MKMYYSPSSKGFYDELSHPRPDDAVELFDDAYLTLLNGVNSGMTIEIVDGEARLIEPTQDEDRPAVKSGLKAMVDAAAEVARLKYITGGAGQAMTYQAKVAEAKAAIADDDLQASSYPLLSAEVGITADDIPAVAAVILAAYSAWLATGGAIEAVRLGAKAAIDAATSTADARAVYQAIEWP